MGAGERKTGEDVLDSGFSHDDFNEAHYARIVAKHFGNRSPRTGVEPDVLETVETLTIRWRSRFGDPRCFDLFTFRVCRKHVTVACRRRRG